MKATLSPLSPPPFLPPSSLVQWFFGNYLYAEALLRSSVALVNTLSGTSAVLVMVLAALPFLQTSDKDKFTLSRLAVTLTR